MSDTMEHFNTCSFLQSCTNCISSGLQVVKLTNNTICCIKSLTNLDATFTGIILDPSNCPDITSQGWKIEVLLVLLVSVAIMVTLASILYWKRNSRQQQMQILQNDEHKLVTEDNVFDTSEIVSIFGDIELQETSFNNSAYSMSSV